MEQHYASGRPERVVYTCEYTSSCNGCSTSIVGLYYCLLLETLLDGLRDSVARLVLLDLYAATSGECASVDVVVSGRRTPVLVPHYCLSGRIEASLASSCLRVSAECGRERCSIAVCRGQ